VCNRCAAVCNRCAAVCNSYMLVAAWAICIINAPGYQLLLTTPGWAPPTIQRLIKLGVNVEIFWYTYEKRSRMGVAHFPLVLALPARTLKGPATGTKQLSKRAQRGNRLRGLECITRYS
ncbi:MAG: hypothetical protein AB4352_12280, partial [Hormoscilla sp.]